MMSLENLEVKQEGDVTVVGFGQRQLLDESAVNAFGDALLRIGDQPGCRRVVLNFAGVQRVSSAMLAKLVGLQRKLAARNETLTLCNVSPEIRSILTTTHLHRILEIRDEG